MAALEVISTSEPDRWQEALDLCKPYDFYHLHAFHRLAEDNGEGKAAMTVFEEDGFVIAFPMLFREIETPLCPPFVEGLRDAGCVYGFPGPLVSSPGIPEHVRCGFLNALTEFYQEHKVVSAFCRLHPLIPHRSLLEGFGCIVDVGVTVAIDLTMPPEEQTRHYRRNHRQDIDRLRRMGYVCREAGLERLDDFVRIYISTMDRVNANRTYYFSESYFRQMMQDMDGVMHLFVCESSDGEVASAALCAICNDIIQVHLAGTTERHRRFAPMKMLFDGVRVWGNEIGAKAVHLGGGVGAQRDSLFEFKLGFGTLVRTYATWQHVVNQEAHDLICANLRSLTGAETDNSYFPGYRNPQLLDALQVRGISPSTGLASSKEEENKQWRMTFK